MKQILLGECADFLSGGTPSKKNMTFWNGSIPWVSAKDMKSLFLDSTIDKISKEGAFNGSRLVSKGSILILVRGMTLFKRFPVCLLQKEMAFNQDIKAIKVEENIIYSGYLAYWLVLKEQYFLSLVDCASHGTGRIHTNVLKSVPILLPPLEEQKKEYVLSKQVLRSGTAIGALVREAEQAESKADFIHKLAIALKEANETEYWIELLHQSGYINPKSFQSIATDLTELLKLLTAIIKKAKENRNN